MARPSRSIEAKSSVCRVNRVRVKRTILKAVLKVNTHSGEVTCLNKMVDHLRKNQRIVLVIEFTGEKCFDGCQVSIRSKDAEFKLKNNSGVIREGRVVLDDVRFLDSTERRSKMDLIISVDGVGRDRNEFTFQRAIKITADGPRNRASKSKKKLKNDLEGSRFIMSSSFDSPPNTPSETSFSSSSSSSSQSSAPSSPSSECSNSAPEIESDHSEYYDRVFSAYFERDVKTFELMFKLDNFVRGNPLPDSYVNQIVEKFSFLWYNQYFWWKR